MCLCSIHTEIRDILNMIYNLGGQTISLLNFVFKKVVEISFVDPHVVVFLLIYLSQQVAVVALQLEV